MAMFEVSANMRVRPGQLDWFLSSDGTECEVREAYTGPG